MLAKANKVCERLWKDESGVVLALTVVVFLSLFMMAVSVFAVGENIRQRIALQNAADAAAYSGSVIQADALSRLAILNQAMSWEYAQLCKIQMDYIIGKWAKGTIMTYRISAWAGYVAALAAAIAEETPFWQVSVGFPPEALPPYTPPFDDLLFTDDRKISTTGDWRAAVPNIPPYLPAWVGSIKEVQKASDWFTDDKADELRKKMDEQRSEVKRLSKYENWIQENLRTKIESAVQYVLRANLVGDAQSDLYWALSLAEGKAKTTGSGSSELPPMLTTETDQDKFFRLCGINNQMPLLSWYFGPGWKTWYRLTTDDISRDGNADESAHEYKDFPGLNSIWFVTPDPPGTPIPGFWSAGLSRDLYPSPNPDKYFESGCAPQAKILTQDYFKRSGAVSVGVSRKMRNPFSSYLDSDASKGIFGLFDVGDVWSLVPGRGRKSWAVAVARAGYKKPGGEDGEYDPHATADWVDNNREQDKGNLSIRDWDAVLIPIRRAWVMNTGDGWEGGKDCTTEVMKAFAEGDADAEWKGLFLSALGATSPGKDSTRQGWGDSSLVERTGSGSSISWDVGEGGGGGEDSPKVQMERAVWH